MTADDRTMTSPELPSEEELLLALRRKIMEAKLEEGQTEASRSEALAALDEISAILLGQGPSGNKLLAEGLLDRGQLSRLKMMKRPNGTLHLK